MPRCRSTRLPGFPTVRWQPIQPRRYRGLVCGDLRSKQGGTVPEQEATLRVPAVKGGGVALGGVHAVAHLQVGWSWRFQWRRARFPWLTAKDEG